MNWIRKALFNLLKDDIDKETARIVPLAIERCMFGKLEEYRELLKQYTEALQKNAKLFKGFQGPNQYLTFIQYLEPRLVKELIEVAKHIAGMRSLNMKVLPTYVELDASNCYKVGSDEALVLGALDFSEPVSGDVRLYEGDRINRIYHVRASNETWLPLPLFLFKGDEIFSINAPRKPLVHVIRAAPVTKG